MNHCCSRTSALTVCLYCSRTFEMSIFSFMALLFSTSFVLSNTSGDTFNAELSNITALSGACVQIPCSYNVSDFENKLERTRSIFGSWLKTTHRMTGLIFNGSWLKTTGLILNGSPPIIKGFNHIEMVGNLSRRECTTVFYNVTKNHSDIYYFRVEMEPVIFRATFINAVNVTVLDVPNPPELNNVETVMEGTTVSLRCSAQAPCPTQPPTLSWSLIPTSANITTQLQEKPDKTQSVISTMTFNASYTDHQKNISCNVTYPTNISNNTTVENNVQLQVQFPPKETRIKLEPNTSVFVGTNVTLTCKSKANPSYDMNYTWYKRGEMKLLAFGENMTFNVSKINEGCYFCRAENKHGTQTSEDIQLIVEAGFIVESSDSFIPLVVGCVGGALAFLLFFLLAIVFIRKRRTQASNKPVIGEADLSDQVQNKDEPISSIYMNRAFESSEPPEMTNDDSDTIHYGEINFSTIRTKNHTERSSGQEIIYAEVCHQGKKMNQD